MKVSPRARDFCCAQQNRILHRRGNRQHLEGASGTMSFLAKSGVFSFCIIFYMTGSARYVIPLTPPLVLLIVREAEARLDLARFKRFAAYALCLSSALALPLAVADYQFAGIYREFASHLRTRYSGLAGRIWFVGEWGLRAYLEGLGGEQLGRCDSRPKTGDLLVVPTLATPASFQSPSCDPGSITINFATKRQVSRLRLYGKRAAPNPPAYPPLCGGPEYPVMRAATGKARRTRAAPINRSMM